MRALVLLLPVLCLAQGPPIGIIQVYGNRKVPEAEVRKIVGAREGGQLPRSKGEIEEKLTTLDNVVAANLFAACCDDQRTILYVGLEEKGSTHFAFNSEPAADNVTLPVSIGLAYVDFLKATSEAARTGDTAEQLVEGHSLMHNARARYVQMGFVTLAEENKSILKQVLREAADPEQRAIAAYVIGYAKNKASVEGDLQYALRDPDSTVRANALRALAAFIVYARKNPESGLKVSATWLVEMLNSLVWTDRNNAAVALVTLTEDRDAGILEQLHERAFSSVIEMARWKYLPHALPGFILAGRLAGVPEPELQDAWNKEQREPIIKRALSSGKK